MIRNNRISLVSLAILALVGSRQPCFGGTITFTGDSALVTALGGTIATGVNEVTIGQTVSVPFSATVSGVESVSGTVVLSDSASGGSVQLENVVFTVLSSASSSATFGLSTTQEFAAGGPNTLSATEAGTAAAHLTAPGAQIEPGGSDVSASVTYQPTIKPDSNGNSSGIIPISNTVIAFPSDTFPSNQSFPALSQEITGISKTSSNPVTLVFSYSTTVSAFNTTLGAGSSTTLSAGSFGFVVPSAVPEPSSMVMFCLGMSGMVMGWRRHRKAR